MSKVSIFEKISVVTNPENIDLDEYLEQTRDGRWKDIVSQCRSIEDKKERDAFKRTMPTTTLSGEFERRSDAGLRKHNGYISIDLDEVDDVLQVKKKLENDKYVFSVFLSTSGNGLRVMFAIDPKKHREAFLGIAQYLFERYGQISDPNGINISKPYVVSYDPLLYISYNPVSVFKHYVKEVVVKKIPDFVHTAGDFEQILKEITGKRVDICQGYNEWLKVGFALAEQFGEDGRYYFHEISRIGSTYDVKTTDKQYTHCLKARGQSKANISTFYYLAKEAGVKITSEQTKIIVKTTKSGKRVGLTKSQIIENLLKNSNISNADKVVDIVFESEDEDFGYDDNTSILESLEMFISNNYSLKMNEVTGFLEQSGKPLSQSDLNTLWVAATKKIPTLQYPVMMRLLKSDFIPHYNPFFEFFASDGMPVYLPTTPVKGKKFDTPLIDALADTIKNDDAAYTLYFLKKWLVSCISSAHKVHSPLLLCLLGGQGTGKTEFLRRLPPDELKNYYAESKLDKEKDDEILMTENLWIMDDELGGKSKQDNQKLKNITSKQHFSLRRPYADHNEKILRIAVLCGTSNFNEILTDPTGNRRIIPIDVHDIDKEAYNKIDKTALWREIYRTYKDGFDWRINHEDTGYLNQDRLKYEVVIKEREMLQKFYCPGDETFMSTTEILDELENITRQKFSVNALGSQLKELGFINKTVRNGYSTQKKWGVEKTNRVSTEWFAPNH